MRINDKIGFVILIGSIVLIYLIVSNNDKKKHQQLISRGIYAIAEISFYKPRDARPSKVRYTFVIKGQIYKDSQSSRIPSEVKVGNKYFLLVNEEDYKKTEIFFNYPIKDSTDFKRYVKEFEEKRKQKTKKKN